MTQPIQGIALPIPRTGADRATLVRRTYALVFGGVITTMIGVAVGMTQAGLMEWVASHWFLSFLLLFFAPMMVAQWSKNGIVALGSTFATGLWLSPIIFIANRTQPGIVSQAAMLTLTTFGVLTLYATFSKRDFSAWGSFFVVGLWVLIGVSLLNLFFRNETASLWLAGGTVLIFGGLLVFDTWRIVRSNQYGPDDYVPAAISIYLDLLNLFLAILRLLGGRRN